VVRGEERRSSGDPLHTADRLLLASATCTYAAYYLLAASVVFLLARELPRSEASRLGGALITTVYASAVGGTLLIGALGRRYWGRAGLWLTPVVMAGAGVGLGVPGALEPRVA